MNGSGGFDVAKVKEEKEEFDVEKVKKEKEDFEANEKKEAGKIGEKASDPRNNEDDDPVVHEIPVFLAKSLEKNLYLLQYPVRPGRMSYDTSTVVSSRVKPDQRKVEITAKLNTECPNFDRSNGEQIALRVDGGQEEDALFPASVMDRLTLSSTRTVTDTGRYAVGILDGNEFHVTPLSAVLSLRPDFEFLDKSDQTARKEGRLDEDEAEDAPEDGQVKQVSVRFARAGGSREKAQQKAADEMREKKLKEEPWTDVRFNHVKSKEWKTVSQSLFCQKMDEEIKNLDLSPNEYLQSLQ